MRRLDDFLRAMRPAAFFAVLRRRWMPPPDFFISLSCSATAWAGKPTCSDDGAIGFTRISPIGSRELITLISTLRPRAFRILKSRSVENRFGVPLQQTTYLWLIETYALCGFGLLAKLGILDRSRDLKD